MPVDAEIVKRKRHRLHHVVGLGFALAIAGQAWIFGLHVYPATILSTSGCVLLGYAFVAFSEMDDASLLRRAGFALALTVVGGMVSVLLSTKEFFVTFGIMSGIVWSTVIWQLIRSGHRVER